MRSSRWKQHGRGLQNRIFNLEGIVIQLLSFGVLLVRRSGRIREGNTAEGASRNVSGKSEDGKKYHHLSP
jgi:hypothetical protein